MRRGLNSQAYTIVEVIIVLAVSSALLVSALLLVGGQQNKTQFYQSVRDTEQQVQDIINNVATGYYSRSTDDFSCYKLGSVPFIDTTGSNPLGSNKECMYIGRVIQFNVGGVPENFAVYNIVGLRENATGGAITDLAQAQPTLVDSTTENRTLKYGLSANSMVDGAGTPIGAVGFISTLGQTGAAGLESGSQHIELYPVSNLTLNWGHIELLSGQMPFSAITNSVTVCFDSGSTDQHADLIIGGNGRQTSTQLNIGSGQC